MTYNSIPDNQRHIGVVREKIEEVINYLRIRAIEHDKSKLKEPEKSMYDIHVPRLRELEYGSPEYEKDLKEMGFALQHHFESNRHHPEHFEDGIDGMTLVDLVEMLCDWKASSMRTGQELNLEANRKRFKIDDQLFSILKNTVKDVGW